MAKNTTKIDDEIASVKASLQALLDQKKQIEKKQKMKITKQTPGISEAISAIENASAINELDFAKILHGIAKIKKVDLGNNPYLEEAQPSNQTSPNPPDNKAPQDQIPAFTSNQL